MEGEDDSWKWRVRRIRIDDGVEKSEMKMRKGW
jgi:hypothetical protein